MCCGIPDIPKSDAERLVFPYNDICGFYNTDDFNENEFNGKLTRRELEQMMSRVKRKRNAMRGAMLCCYCWFILTPILLATVAAPLILTLVENTTEYWIYLVALLPPAVTLAIAIISCVCWRVKNDRLSQYVKEEGEKFVSRGIRLNNGRKSRWIELWMDFKFKNPNKHHAQVVIQIK